MIKVLKRIIILIVLISCKDEEPIDHKIIATETPNEIESGGIILNGYSNINSSERGFVLGVDSNFSSYETKWLICLNTEDNYFSKTIISNLIEGKTYFFKSYIKQNVNLDEEVIVFGETRSFESNGSTPHQILSFYPTKATIKDTITINHFNIEKNFDLFLNNNDEKLQLYNRDIISYNDSIIKFTIPYDIKFRQNNIEIKSSNNTVISENYIELSAPKIESLSTNVIFLDETITIMGQNFGFENKLNKVYLNNTEVEIIESNRNKIICKIPNNLTSTKFKLSVNSQLQTTESIDSLNFRKPIIQKINTNEGFSKDEITITGQYFNPNDVNIIFNNKFKSEIISKSINSITFKVPHRPTKERNTRFTYTSSNIDTLMSNNFYIKDKWLFVSNSINPIRYQGIFNIGTDNYMLYFESLNIKVLKFNSINKEWEFFKNYTSNILPQNWSLRHIEHVVVDDNVYVFFSNEKDGYSESGNDNTSRNFVTFNINNSFITSLSLPNEEIDFGINLVGHYNNLSYIYYKRDKLYTYDITTNKWETTNIIGSELATPFSSPASGYEDYNNAIYFDNKIYLFPNSRHTGMLYIYEFDLATKTTTKLNSFNSPISFGSTYKKENEVYISNILWNDYPDKYTRIWKFSSVNKTITQLEDPKVENRGESNIFIQNNKLYVQFREDESYDGLNNEERLYEMSLEE